jgi:hypothetical protein
MIDVGDDGKIADVCAVHEDGLKLYFSIQRSALSDRPKLSPQRTLRTQKKKSAYARQPFWIERQEL